MGCDNNDGSASHMIGFWPTVLYSVLFLLLAWSPKTYLTFQIHRFSECDSSWVFAVRKKLEEGYKAVLQSCCENYSL